MRGAPLLVVFGALVLASACRQPTGANTEPYGAIRVRVTPDELGPGEVAQVVVVAVNDADTTETWPRCGPILRLLVDGQRHDPYFCGIPEQVVTVVDGGDSIRFEFDFRPRYYVDGRYEPYPPGIYYMVPGWELDGGFLQDGDSVAFRVSQ
jgi:hypothetical protein